jgi:hypothetical protein
MFKFHISQFKTCSAIAVIASTMALADLKAAYAFSFSVSPVGVTTQTSWAGIPNTVIDFNSVSDGNVPTTPIPLATSATNGNVSIQQTDSPAIYTSFAPLFTGGGRYLAVGSGPELSQEGVVRLAFDAPRGLGYFGLFWGSPSLNDRIVFNLRDAAGAASSVTYDAAVVFAGLGLDLTPTPDTSAGRYVNFFSTSTGPNANKVISSVILEDRGAFFPGNVGGLLRSFQVDNIAYHQIPTPALLPGLIGLGFGILKKKRKQSAMAAV